MNTPLKISQLSNRNLHHSATFYCGNSSMQNLTIPQRNGMFNTPKRQGTCFTTNQDDFSSHASMTSGSQNVNALRYGINSSQQSLDTNFLMGVITTQAKQIEHLVQNFQNQSQPTRQSLFPMNSMQHQMTREQFASNDFGTFNYLQMNNISCQGNNFNPIVGEPCRFSTPINPSKDRQMRNGNPHNFAYLMGNSPFYGRSAISSNMMRIPPNPCANFIPEQISKENLEHNWAHGTRREKRQVLNRGSILSLSDYTNDSIQSDMEEESIDSTELQTISNVRKMRHSQTNGKGIKQKYKSGMKAQKSKRMDRKYVHATKNIVKRNCLRTLRRIGMGRIKKDTMYRPPYRIAKMMILPRCLPLRITKQPKKFGNLVPWKNLILKTIFEKKSKYKRIEVIEVKSETHHNIQSCVENNIAHSMTTVTSHNASKVEKGSTNIPIKKQSPNHKKSRSKGHQKKFNFQLKDAKNLRQNKMQLSQGKCNICKYTNKTNVLASGFSQNAKTRRKYSNKVVKSHIMRPKINRKHRHIESQDNYQQFLNWKESLDEAVTMEESEQKKDVCEEFHEQNE